MLSDKVYEIHGSGMLLRKLAEECCELGQACLKLVCVWEKESPMPEEEARQKLVEEMADARLMMEYAEKYVLNTEERRGIPDTMNDKEARMFRRLVLEVEDNA